MFAFARTGAPGQELVVSERVVQVEPFWDELERHAWDIRLEYHCSPQGEQEYWLTTRFRPAAPTVKNQPVSEVGPSYEFVLRRSVGRVREALGLPPFTPGMRHGPSVVEEIRTALEARCWSVVTEFYDAPGADQRNQYRVRAKFFQNGTIGTTVVISEDSTLLGALREALAAVRFAATDG